MAQTLSLDRRKFFAVCAQAGFAATLFPGALYTVAAQAQQGDNTKLQKITPEMVLQAAALANVPITAEQIKAMLDGLNQQRGGYSKLRALEMPNSVAPAVIFDPVPPGMVISRPPRDIATRVPEKLSAAPAVASRDVPRDIEQLAFATVRELAELLRGRKVSSVALTQMYLGRIKRYDPQLHCLITLTEERALTQAKAADAEIYRGNYRGPLHGVPWGVKDLLAVKGYPTTWGAGGFEKQNIDQDATVVTRLDEAGAVLVAKLTLGALAMGDKWFGGRTRNPWNPQQGSSGSSAGPASAASAGLVGFTIGTETLGSISSPSTRCGVTGLRPTFGFVPRTGAMALSWSMDKIGPICRSVEDCALVMQAIYGPDGQDLAVKDAWFNWNADFNWKSLRVGYVKKDFEAPEHKPEKDKEKQSEALSAEEKKKRERQRTQMAAYLARQEYDRRYDLKALDVLHGMGVNLVPIELPKQPIGAMAPLLTAEGAAAFDELTITGRDKLLTEQGPEDWPNVFRVARFYPAVEYIQAQRARTLLIRDMAKLFEQVDIIATPTSGEQLVITNLTGNPSVILPNGIRGTDAPNPPRTDTGDDDSIGGPGTPVSFTFLGGLYRDAQLCAFARAYQQVAGFENLQPPMFAVGTGNKTGA